MRAFRDRQAFTLVEVVIALGITAFCLAVLLGLFAVGLKSSRESSEQIQAAHLAQCIIDTRRTTPNGVIANFPLPLMGTNATTSAATMMIDDNGYVTTSTQSAQFGLKYTITAPVSTGSTSVTNSPVLLYLCLYWPPQSSLANSVGRYEIVTQLPF